MAIAYNEHIERVCRGVCKRCKRLTSDNFEMYQSHGNLYVRHKCRVCVQISYHTKNDDDAGLPPVARGDELDHDHMFAIMSLPCYVCGKMYGNSGPDQLLNHLRHSKSNCSLDLACCWRCNLVRGDVFSVEFMRTVAGPFIRAYSAVSEGMFFDRII